MNRLGWHKLDTGQHETRGSCASGPELNNTRTVSLFTGHSHPALKVCLLLPPWHTCCPAPTTRSKRPPKADSPATRPDSAFPTLGPLGLDLVLGNAAFRP